MTTSVKSPIDSAELPRKTRDERIIRFEVDPFTGFLLLMGLLFWIVEREGTNVSTKIDRSAKT